MTPPLDLDRLEALEQAATEGDWASDDAPVGYIKGRPRLSAIWAMQMGRRVLVGEILHGADGVFILAARNALPHLLRIARAAQVVVEHAKPCQIHESERMYEMRMGRAEVFDALRAALEGRAP